MLYLGRGPHYPLALEGALKLKEISYIHAEGYAAGELKHGPIALIDENTPVVMAAPHDPLLEKSLSNLQEVAARHGKVFLVSDKAGIKQAGKRRPGRSECPTASGRSSPSSRVCRRSCWPTTWPSEGHGRGPAAQPREVGNRGVPVRGRLVGD